MRRLLLFILFLSLLASSGYLSAQTVWTARWLANVTKTQSQQPHWITPVVLVTPRLEQEVRTDFVRRLLRKGQQDWNYENGKGLKVIPQSPMELLFNRPP
jgi:hypothetical protein